MLRKAENPVPFIAGITACEVLERHGPPTAPARFRTLAAMNAPGPERSRHPPITAPASRTPATPAAGGGQPAGPLLVSWSIACRASSTRLETPSLAKA